ncbi:hypothetical protein KJ359_001732 [Pestalotiopsis sp. 9143b]|nr:hypothetical protein KJ359_001732 [Pestalotiopsis sp. 9143b]
MLHHIKGKRVVSSEAKCGTQARVPAALSITAGETNGRIFTGDNNKSKLVCRRQRLEALHASS